MAKISTRKLNGNTIPTLNCDYGRAGIVNRLNIKFYFKHIPPPIKSKRALFTPTSAPHASRFNGWLALLFDVPHRSAFWRGDLKRLWHR